MEKNMRSITTRYPPEVVDSLKRLAQRHNRSFNGEVIQALQEYIRGQEKRNNPDGHAPSL